MKKLNKIKLPFAQYRNSFSMHRLLESLRGSMAERLLNTRYKKEMPTSLLKMSISFLCYIRKIFYSPSKAASIKIPTIIIVMNKYCFFVNFSFKKILDKINDTTHTLERIGAAIAPFPLMAYT